MDIPTLTETRGSDGQPVSGIQYAVFDDRNRIHIYGDQNWVATGMCVEDGSWPDGQIRRRRVAVTYGEWEDVQ